VHGHKLQCRPAFGGLRFAGFQRGVRNKSTGRDILAHLALGFAHEALRGVDQFLQIVDAIRRLSAW
jgi:hypothetical protein